MPPVDRNVRNEHVKLIKRAKRRLDRQRDAVVAAETTYRQTIRDAFTAGLTGDQIHLAAGISKDRAWQINRGVRT
jgi:hypothetical protein